MGYNVNLILVKDLTANQIADIIPDVFEITDEIIDFESASSHNLHPSFAWGKTKDWSIIWDARGKLVLDNHFVQQFSKFSSGLSLEFSSVNDRYGFIYATEGKIIRQVTIRLGKIVITTGQKLEIEPDILDEDALWQLMTAITDLTVQQLQDTQYTLISMD